MGHKAITVEFLRHCQFATCDSAIEVVSANLLLSVMMETNLFDQFPLVYWHCMCYRSELVLLSTGLAENVSKFLHDLRLYLYNISNYIDVLLSIKIMFII